MATTEHPRRRRRFLTVTTATLALGIASVAGAAWLSSGTGTGTADAGLDKELGVTVEFDDGLVPATSRTVTVTITNENPYKVEIDTIELDAAGITSNVQACDDTTTNPAGHHVGYAEPLIGDEDIVVPANDGVDDGETVVTLTDALTMGVDSNNACQGAEFSLPLDVSGFSSEATATPSVTLPTP